MDQTDNYSNPELTFPELEAELVTSAYSDANVILEYGTGASTRLASNLKNRTIYSVVSDPDLAATLRKQIEAAAPPSSAEILYADIGPTGDRGQPVDAGSWRRFANYPLSFWDNQERRHPDVILIDGPFRVACFFASLVNINKKTRILFNDYTSEKSYQLVEEFCKPVRIVGRMAEFVVEPRTYSGAEISKIILHTFGSERLNLLEPAELHSVLATYEVEAKTAAEVIALRVQELSDANDFSKDQFKKNENLLKENKKLRRRIRTAMLPFVILLFPISIPLLLLRKHRKKRKRGW